MCLLNDIFETTGVLDNHLGDREVLYPSFLEYNGTPYTLVALPEDESSWPMFEGRWGNQESAPPGPLFRFDAPSYGVCPSVLPVVDPKGNDGWDCANNKPYDPYNNCAERRDTRIAGDDEHYGPWYWAAGYGLDTPWENAEDCEPLIEPHDFSWNLFLPAILAGASDDTVSTVTSLTDRVWMDRNLGASRVATTSTDAEAYGNLYQWGRGTDGHEKRNSGTITTLSSTDAPEHGNFITTTSLPFDWRSPQNDDLWQGGYGLNNPCPTNFRLPTADEWQAEMDSWSSKDAAAAFASPLKMVMPGQRLYPSGSISETGLRGAYWSSTIDSASSNNSTNYLLVKNDSGTIYTNPRAYGMSVRCIKNVALQEGLVAHYEFEGNANDSSGNGNHGTIHGVPSFLDGIIGKSFNFNGTSNVKTPIELTGIPENQYITIAFWGVAEDKEKSTFVTNYNIGDGANSILFSAKLAGISGGFDDHYYSNGYCLKYYGIHLLDKIDDKTNVCGVENSIEDIYDYNGVPVDYSAWHHYAITYDNEFERIYIDGVKVIEKELEGHLIGGANGVDRYPRDDSHYDRFINIGMQNNSFGYSKSKLHQTALKGQIDDLRVYRRVLNESEILELFNIN